MMRGLSLLLTIATAIPFAAAAQTPPMVPGVQVQGTQKPLQQYYAEDGGVRETLESIVIPPKTQAPFTLTLQTEWVKVMYDGGTITSVNRRRIARDGKGRVYQERWFLVPKNGQQESQMTTLQIADPNKHIAYSCFMLQEPHVCELTSYTPSPNAVYKFESPEMRKIPTEIGSTMHDDLGKQLIEGVETQGTRDSVIYNPNVFGNDRKVTIEREFWYAPSLGINLISKRSDPRFGIQTFTATNLVLSEPDAQLFELPEGFKVLDRRTSTAPEN